MLTRFRNASDSLEHIETSRSLLFHEVVRDRARQMLLAVEIQAEANAAVPAEPHADERVA